MTNSKNIFKKTLATILGGVFLCIALSACNNFMNAANTAQQIQEAIEIANSNPVTVYVRADEGTGTVSTAQLRLKKKETFDIFFRPATGWEFVEWEVLNRQSGEPVTDAIEFKDKTALETKGTVLQPLEGLEIHPKCRLLPAILQVTPDPSKTIMPMHL